MEERKNIGEEKKDLEQQKVDIVRTTAENLKKENDLLEQELNRKEMLRERMRAEEMIGGKSEAGSTPLIQPDLSPKEYAKKVMAGEIPFKK